ncbi:MAG: bifunctional hydroxymethylpyrimidine kinase/phosphomethylpyrimidine kinase, partial [Hyphomicrobium sp.]
MTASEKEPKIALTIAGSDPSGGAGIQADIKTFTVMGVYGASILTSLTAQNTLGVTETYNLPPFFIEQQAKTLASDIRVSAVKTGMLGNAETVQTIIDILKTYSFGPLVVDPVLQSTSGDKLLTLSGLDVMRNQLLPLAFLVTPNLFEASQLLGKTMARSLTEMENQAHDLLKLGIRAVLLKGGHLEHQGKAVDIL